MEINTLNILAIGRNPDILQVVCRLINAHEKWTGTAVATVEEALPALDAAQYNMILLCAGITPAEEATLKDRLSALHPDIILMRHFGGGSGLLENEVLAALDRHNIRLC